MDYSCPHFLVPVRDNPLRSPVKDLHSGSVSPPTTPLFLFPTQPFHSDLDNWTEGLVTGHFDGSPTPLFVITHETLFTAPPLSTVTGGSRGTRKSVLDLSHSHGYPSSSVSGSVPGEEKEEGVDAQKFDRFSTGWDLCE